MKQNGIFFCLLLLISFSGFSQRNASANTKQNDNDANVRYRAFEQYRLFLSNHKVIKPSGANTDAAMVQRVSNRIIEAIKTYYTQKELLTELQGYNWEINLVDKKEVNAWCMPGGKIVVYTGLLGFAQNEASLAVVLGHDIAHRLLQHGEERLKRMLKEYMNGKSFQEALTAKPADAKDIFLMAYGIGTGMGNNIGVMPPFSLKKEIEADKLGLIFAALAGYNPREALVLWQRMSRLSRSALQPELLSAHPIGEKRMEEIEERIDEITKNYYKPINKNRQPGPFVQVN